MASRFLLLLLAVALALLTMIAAFAPFPALAHGEWVWIQNYDNGHGTNCCDERDAVVIPTDVATAASVGTVIVAPFLSGAKPVAVKAIYQTEDPQGRAWITLHGCLFRWSGG